MPAAPTTSVLTPEEKEHFLTHGWVKIPAAFTREQAEPITHNVWTRLGMDPNDKSTWTSLRINMPSHKSFDASELCPRAWAAITELCGGQDRVQEDAKMWRDSLIVNLGTPEGEGKPMRPQDLEGWHVDGDFFIHYLDSPEQGLLVIPLFTDIVPHGGGTMICPQAIPKLAKHLYEHPEGVDPRMGLRTDPDFRQENNLDWFNNTAKSCSEFVEVTGNLGDVYLLHPLMLHTASDNALRKVRIITNPPIGLREPFNFDREDGNYSLVEQVTLRALGKERLEGWKIATPTREQVVPMRVKIQEEMKRKELERLEGIRKQQEEEEKSAAQKEKGTGTGGTVVTAAA
ncbi:hypothetical protein QBC43DRAFT_310995 [Cladorrhinum sp. PSN259]|nr:hypothetical protein QBC43DRAFT_310995 [Cladorrhinum sp. PSN259]